MAPSPFIAVVRGHDQVHDLASGSLAAPDGPRVSTEIRFMDRTDDASPEFSRIIAVHELDDHETRLDLRATEGECRKLAERFGIPAVSSLSATARLARLTGGRVRLQASFRAEITQTCVVTLEPIDGIVEEGVDIEFEPRTGDAGAFDVAYDPSADREPLPGDSLDVGEIIAGELALSLDPYPRKPGVSVEIGPGGTAGDGEGPPAGGPFEALAALKRKD